MTIRRRTFALVVAGLLAATGCGTGEPLAELATSTETRTVGDVVAENGEAGEGFGGDFSEYDGNIDVSDQSSDGAVVTVSAASIQPGPGWVVIYTDQDGSPADVLGKAEVEDDLEDIQIALDETLEAGGHTLWAQLHVDAQPVGTFQYPGEDVPVTFEDGDVVQASFRLTVTDE